MNPMMGVMGGGGAPSTGNVMQITATLRNMPDAQLQQYAAMHKNDPFVFPLAFQESRTRQQMRAGQAAQMAGQKPPPVVDQDLAQMTPTPITGGAGQAITGGHGQAINALPEEQGIGALNAPNLQRMADGGIAGYADGGPQQPGMFNYAQMAPAVDLHPDSGVTPRSMAGGGIIGYADKGVVDSFTEMRKIILKELGVPSTSYIQDAEVKRTVDKLAQERLGTPTTPTTPTTSSAAPARPYQKAFEVGQKFGPTIKKVGDTVSNIGGKVPLGGGAATAGVLGLGSGLYEGYTQGDFYNDPEVSSGDKAIQAGRTAVRSSLPMVGAGLGSLFTPVGTAVGTLAGTAASYNIDAESEALKAWKKAHPQATTPVTSPAAETPAVENKESPKAEDVLAEPTAPKAPWSPGIVAPQIATSGGIGGKAPTAEGAKQQANTFLNPDTFRPDIENEVTETGVGIAQQRALRDKMLAGRKTPYKDYEERLKAQEAKEPEEKERLTGLSLLEAGLAVMGGDSPYAFQNLSRATAGVKTYSEGIKDLKKSKDLRDRAFADIEQARTAQANNDIDRSIEFEDRASGKMQEARRWGISSLQNLGMENAKMAGHAYDNALNNYGANQRQASSNAAHIAGINAQMQMEANKLNMAPPEARMAMMLGDGNLETGLAKMAAIQAGKLNPTKEYLDYKAKAVGKVDAYGQPVPIQSPSEFFADLAKAQLALAAMGGPGKPTNTAPSVLRPDK